MPNTLRSRVRNRLLRRQLPPPPAEHCWARPADGAQACAACDAPIPGHDMEFEARWPGGRVLFFHVDCLGLWESVAAALRIPRRSAG